MRAVNAPDQGGGACYAVLAQPPLRRNHSEMSGAAAGDRIFETSLGPAPPCGGHELHRGLRARGAGAGRVALLAQADPVSPALVLLFTLYF